MGCTQASGKRSSNLSKKEMYLSDTAKRTLMPMPLKSDRLPPSDFQHDEHFYGHVSLRPLMIDHSNSTHKKPTLNTNNFVSTKGNLSEDSHLNHQAPILESKLYATPMDSLLKENITLLGKDFDSFVNISEKHDSGLDLQGKTDDTHRPNNVHFFNNHAEISQIQSEESLFEGRQGKRDQENFKLELSDFPEYKFFDEESGSPLN